MGILHATIYTVSPNGGNLSLSFSMGGLTFDPGPLFGDFAFPDFI